MLFVAFLLWAAYLTGLWHTSFAEPGEVETRLGTLRSLRADQIAFSTVSRGGSGIFNLPQANYPDLDIVGDPTIDHASNNRYFNPFVQQLNGTSRSPNAARTEFEPCSYPARAVRGQFRLVTLNTFSTPILRSPNTNPSSQANLPRNGQLGFKLNF